MTDKRPKNSKPEQKNTHDAVQTHKKALLVMSVRLCVCRCVMYVSRWLRGKRRLL